MISQTLEYALRAVVTIAQHEGAPCTARRISEISRVPSPYLSKLMQGLAHANVVCSKRGLRGGFVLAKPSSELTVWEVVDAVEPIKRIYQCPLGVGSHGTNLCPLHQRLDDAMAMLEKLFRRTTIAELLKPIDSVAPFCDDQSLLTINPQGGEVPATKKKSQKRKPAGQTDADTKGIRPDKSTVRQRVSRNQSSSLR